MLAVRDAARACLSRLLASCVPRRWHLFALRRDHQDLQVGPQVDNNDLGQVLAILSKRIERLANEIHELSSKLPEVPGNEGEAGGTHDRT